MGNLKITHKRSSVITDNEGKKIAKLPKSEQLDYGELAINYADGVETISIKNSNNEIVEFKSKDYVDNAINDVNEQINAIDAKIDGINTMEPSNYYDKDNIDKKLDAKADKVVVDGVKITADSALTTANSALTSLSGYSKTTHNHDGVYSKLGHDHPEYENQNAFSNVRVGSATVSADETTDTLEISGTNGVTISADTTSDKIIISGPDLSGYATTGSVESAQTTANSALTKVTGGTDPGHTHSIYAKSSDLNKKSDSDHTHGNLILSGDVSGSTTISSGTSDITLEVSVKDNSHSHNNYVPTSRTINGKELTSNINITASDLGLESAFKYHGTTTTSISDGSTTQTVVIDGKNHTAENGCVVAYGNKEFVWTGSKWEELGNEGNYKVKQTAVSDPSASGTSLTFISTISQDDNGVITATKKTVRTATTGQTGVAKIITGEVSGKTYTAGEAAAAAHTHGNYENQNAFSNVRVGSTNVSADTTSDTLEISGTNGVTISADTTNDKIIIKGPDLSGYANQNAFSSVQTDSANPITASSATSLLKLVSGSNVTLTPNQTAGTITISSTNTTYNAASQSAQGLMSAADKKKLDGIASGANAYSLPAASTSALGGIKTAYSQSGKNYPVQLDSSYNAYVNVPWTDNNTTYNNATSAATGIVKIISGDVNGKTYTAGEAAAAAHSHSEYIPKAGGTFNGDVTHKANIILDGGKQIYETAIGGSLIATNTNNKTVDIAFGAIKNPDNLYTTKIHGNDIKFIVKNGVPAIYIDENKNTTLYGDLTVNGDVNFPKLEELETIIKDNEYVTSLAAADLDERVSKVEKNIENIENFNSDIDLSIYATTDFVTGQIGTINEQIGTVNNKFNNYATKNHATSATTYGVGTTADYGHVKISNGDVSTVAHANGLVAGMDHTHGNYATTGTVETLTESASTAISLAQKAQTKADSAGSSAVTAINTAENVQKSLSGYSKSDHTHYNFSLNTHHHDGIYSKINHTHDEYLTGITSSQVKTALGTGSGTTKYLREDGTWVTPPNTTYSNATSAATGIVKIINGDVKNKTYTAGEAAAAAHTHSNYLTGISKTQVTNALGYTPPTTTEVSNQISSLSGTVDTRLAGKSDTGHNHDSVYSKTGHTHSNYATTTAVNTAQSTADTALSTATDAINRISSLSGTVDTKLVGKSDTGHSHTKSEIGLGNVTNHAQVKRSEMGVANGVATLDANGLVPTSQLPSYVDDVLEYTAKSNFPTTGVTGKIYVDTSTNKTYRWGGSAYVEISASLALGTTSSTAYRGDLGAQNASNISTLQGYFDSSAAKLAKQTLYGITVGNKTFDGSSAITITKSDLGLGNVENKSSATIRSEITKANVTNALGYTPPTSTEVSNQISSLSGTVDTRLAGKSDTGHNHDSVYSKTGHTHSSYVNQNAFSSVQTDSTNPITASSTTSLLKLVSGSNVTLTPNQTAGTITISSTNTTYNAASQSAQGLMSAADKKKLDGIASGANAYSLPAASTSVLGGIKTAYSQSGKNYPVQLDSSYNAYVNVPWTDNNTTYNNATSAATGIVKIISGDVKSKTYTAGEAAAAAHTHSNYLTSITKTQVTNALGYTPPTTTDVANQIQGLSGTVDTRLAGKSDTGHTHSNYSTTSHNHDSVYSKTGHTHSSYVNQNAFSSVQTDSANPITASSATSLLKLVSGSNVTLTPNQTAGTITISATDTNTTYSAASQSAQGLMSAADKKKLDGIASGANAYSHPTSSGNKHIPSGGSSGQILRWSADGTAVWGNDNNTTYGVVSTSANGLAPKVTDTTKYLRGDGTWATPTNTTYSNATTGTSGLMSATDKAKLDGIASSANNYSLPTATSSTLGGVKVGSNISLSSGTISLSKTNVTTALGYTPPTTTEVSNQISSLSGTVDTRLAGKSDTGHTHSNYLTGITKAQVTTALGYTPPQTDTNTTYSAGSFLSLSGTQFNVLTGTSSSTVARGNHSHSSYVNQNAFSSVQTDSANPITASSATSLLKLVSGSNVTLTPNQTAGTITISATDTNTTYSAASQSAQGLMSAADKKKLDGIASGANAYSLPAASTSVLGGIKTAYSQSGKNYPVQLDSSYNAYVNVPWTDNNTHYTTRLYAGASGTASNASTSNPYVKITDDNTYRNQIRLVGSGATTISSDANGNITISSTDTNTNTTYSAGSFLSLNGTSFSVSTGTSSSTVARGDHSHSSYATTTAVNTAQSTANTALSTATDAINRISSLSGTVDTRLAGKSDTGHNHDSVYSKTGHTHNNYATTSVATTSANGLMSSSHVASLNNAVSGVNTLSSEKLDKPGAWTTPSLVSGATSASANPVRYRKCGNLLTIQGAFTYTYGSTADGTLKLFTLPSGYRSSYTNSTWQYATGNWMWRLYIDNAGVVYVHSIVNPKSNATTNTSSMTFCIQVSYYLD